MDTVLTVIWGFTLISGLTTGVDRTLTIRLATGFGGLATIALGFTAIALGLAAVLTLALSLGLVQLHSGNVVLAGFGSESRELPTQVSAGLVDRLEGVFTLRAWRASVFVGERDLRERELCHRRRRSRPGAGSYADRAVGAR